MSFNGSASGSIGEILNVGVGAAVDTLSTILGNTVNLTCGDAVEKQIKEADFASIMPAMYVMVEYSGAITGRSIAIYRKMDLSIILSVLMNNDDASGEFDELSLGMLKEIINQMSNEFALKLSEFFGAQINIRISDIMPFENNETISEEFDKKVIDYVLIDSFQFDISNMLKGKFVYIFDEAFSDSVTALGDGDRRNIQPPVDETVHQTPVQPAPQYSAPVQQNPYAQPQAAPMPQVQQRPSRFSSPVNVKASKFPDFADSQSMNGIMAPLSSGNMDLLMDVPLNVSVEIGKTKRRMKEILSFTQGTVIPIDKQAGAPVDIIVNGQLIARGDVVVIDDNFGVRITELVNRDLQEKE